MTNRKEKVNTKLNSDKLYIGFPYVTEGLSRTKKMVKRLRLNKRITFAPKIMRSMKKNIFSNLKSKTNQESMVHATAFISCETCNFTSRIKTECQSLLKT